ncbi:MAG TPA: hypothetical protein GX700_08400, partial [Paracoccus sp.]|nr:hypothetical protein [Paracoccus sp. (in: a-proteobacteria)]
MDAFKRLRDALWNGPLTDPQAPAQALAARLAGLDYGSALAGLRRLSDCALPLDPALRAALVRWPWSIDLALIAVENDPNETTFSELCARAQAQDRRRATVA